MKRAALSTSLILLMLATTGARAGEPAGQVFVTNSNDSGAGSFRAAIEQANGDVNITRIHFLGSVSTISLASTVRYTGFQGLTIDGNGASLDGSGIALISPAFLALGGGDLTGPISLFATRRPKALPSRSLRRRPGRSGSRSSRWRLSTMDRWRRERRVEDPRERTRRSGRPREGG
jgi:hypothetical protein